MSIKRFNPRSDGNQKEIVDCLLKLSYRVYDLKGVGSGFPDLLVAKQGRMWLMEVKNPQTKGKLNKKQEVWHQNWEGPKPWIIETIADVIFFHSAVEVAKRAEKYIKQ